MKYSREHAESQLDGIERGDVIAVYWCVDDVLTVAEEMNIELTIDEARDILQEVARRHDASIGIDWIVIESHIDMWVYERDNYTKQEEL